MVAIREAMAPASPNRNPLQVHGQARGRHPCNLRSTLEQAAESATQKGRDGEAELAEDLAAHLLIDQHPACVGPLGPDLARSCPNLAHMVEPTALETHAAPKPTPPVECRGIPAGQ
jgi:hypothetical protein